MSELKNDDSDRKTANNNPVSTVIENRQYLVPVTAATTNAAVSTASEVFEAEEQHIVIPVDRQDAERRDRATPPLPAPLPLPSSSTTTTVNMTDVATEGDVATPATTSISIIGGPPRSNKKSSFSRIFAKVFGHQHQSEPSVMTTKDVPYGSVRGGPNLNSADLDVPLERPNASTAPLSSRNDEVPVQSHSQTRSMKSSEGSGSQKSNHRLGEVSTTTTVTTTPKTTKKRNKNVNREKVLSTHSKKLKTLKEASVSGAATAAAFAKTSVKKSKVTWTVATSPKKKITKVVAMRKKFKALTKSGTVAATTYGPDGTLVVTERQKRGRPTKTTYRPVTQVDLNIQIQQINDAVAVVTETLRSSAYPALFMNHVEEHSSNNNNNNGSSQNNLSLWPSPYRTLNSKISGRSYPSQPTGTSVNTMLQHHTHMNSICASIEKFANDIVQPAVMTEIKQTLVVENKRTGRDSNKSTLDALVGSSRAFFGTLLLLRELLIQNIHAIFGPSVLLSFSSNRTSDDGPTSQIPNNSQTPSVNLSLSEVQEFEKQIFVSAIILTGLQNVTMNGHHYKFNDGSDETHTTESMMDTFLYCMDMYDRGHAAFFDCLQELDSHDLSSDSTDKITTQNQTIDIANNESPPIRAIFANRHPMDDAEHLAWTISCNYQRTLHPIYKNHINRIETARRKQNDYIYSSLNNVTINVDEATSELSVGGDTVNNSKGILHCHTNGLRVISPNPTAVHISILKIRSKT